MCYHDYFIQHIYTYLCVFLLFFFIWVQADIRTEKRKYFLSEGIKWQPFEKLKWIKTTLDILMHPEFFFSFSTFSNFTIDVKKTPFLNRMARASFTQIIIINAVPSECLPDFLQGFGQSTTIVINEFNFYNSVIEYILCSF